MIEVFVAGGNHAALYSAYVVAEISRMATHCSEAAGTLPVVGGSHGLTVVLEDRNALWELFKVVTAAQQIDCQDKIRSVLGTGPLEGF